MFLKSQKLTFIFVSLCPAISGAEKLGFNSDVRPILSDHCFTCHGFDSNAREADLRLDTAEGAFSKRESGQAIVPGDLAGSLVWQRIITDDPDDVMPPADHFLKLDEKDKALLKRWIEEGAPYEKHWTFTEVTKAALSGNEKHAIDELVLRRLQKEELTLSAEADKRTLIRRLSFDLRGLPPSVEEVETHLADSSPEAWGDLVDRFIADPAFGERFSWPWLDAARYADSNGYQGDRERTMWPWRDWVIEAINKNVPYDDFTVWQIAGDLLPNATEEQILATGFLRNYAINGEGGRIPEENRVDYVFDMAETVGTVWMGLTFNCCRCHDHKYDPLAQSEYYSLTAFFNQTPVTGGGGDPHTKPLLSVHSPEEKAEMQKLNKEINKRKKKNIALAASLDSEGDAWEKGKVARLALPAWTVFVPSTVEMSVAGVTYKTLDDQSILTSGANPRNLTYTLRVPVPKEGLTSLRLDALRHPSMTKGGIARSDSGNFVLTDLDVILHAPGRNAEALVLTQPVATFEQGALKVANVLDEDPKSGWAILSQEEVKKDHAAIFQLKTPLAPQEDAFLEIVLRHDSQHAQHYLGRFRISHSNDPKATFGAEVDELNTILGLRPEKRSKEQNDAVRSAHLAEHPEYEANLNSITLLEKHLGDLIKNVPRVMVMADQETRRKTHILAIGSYEARGEEVEAGTPAVLPPLNAEGPATRLDLARWLVDRKNPLTSRVTANRLWQELFGIGLVKSTEDFGVQSEVPVHPELLDWLAADFMESGWDFKKLVKTIVSSRVYRQSSQVDSLSLEKDPGNRFHARGPRYRLPSWMIRDQAMSVSGLLVDQIGGAPVKPWQPEGLWAEVTFGKKKYTPDLGEALRRRTVYTFWRRISAPPMIFDNAKREACEVGSYRTNSPLHALAILNDPFYLEAARSLASRAVEKDAADPVAAAFELIMIRPPSTMEITILKNMYEGLRASFANDPKAAQYLIAVGEAPRNADLDEITEAALSSLCLSLLNTDEALTKE